MKLFEIIATLNSGETLRTIINARDAADARRLVREHDTGRHVARLSVCRCY